MEPSLMQRARLKKGPNLPKEGTEAADNNDNKNMMERETEEAYDTLQRYIHLGDDRHCLHTIVNGKCRTCDVGNGFCAMEIPFHQFYSLFAKKMQDF